MSSREELPRFVDPMLARAGPLPNGDGWAVEVKFDGMRLQLRRDGRAVRLRSRPGRDCTEEFPELAAITGALGRHRVLLDGELVCLGADGSPDFASVRRRLRAPGDKAPSTSSVSATNGAASASPARRAPDRAAAHAGARREARASSGHRSEARRTPERCTAPPRHSGAATREQGLEGVVAKRLGSPYLPGARSGGWVKHKHRRTESFLVSGWSPAERRPESLLLARPGPDGSLEPAGSVPFVLANGQADDVRRQLETLVLPPTRRGQRVRRLAPEVRAVVAFHGPTRGPVRDPILRALAPPEPPRSS